ncbi:MAG: hypothetical protein KGI38_04305 [Thaumarchaeota archaeon]|nr:hypothetical protein [Nitrososphaerota archaeon]
MAVDSSTAGPERKDEKSGRKSRLLLAFIILGAFFVSGFLAYEYGYFQASPPAGGPSLMQATCNAVSNSTAGPVEHSASGGNGDHAYFLIVETDPIGPTGPYAGMNGSYYVPITEQWPTMNVKLGQIVSIHVINCATSEPHGFQISFYDDKSPISVQAGQSYSVTFTATEAGTFRVYCGIFCSIHPFMQNGALVVS